jgi:hypothetical protein
MKDEGTLFSHLSSLISRLSSCIFHLCVGHGVNGFSRARQLMLVGCILWLMLLGCQTAELIARVNPSVAVTRTQTVRPTFTRVPPTIPPTPPAPIVLPTTVPPTRVPTSRPAPTRPPTPKPVAPPPAPPPASPTPDLFGGYYYRPVDKGCVSASNTRIEGTVYDNGMPKSGVIVRLSESDHGPQFPAFNDFVTGTDPADYKHIDPTLNGKYRLSPAEGQRVNGNWWVFLIDGSGNPISHSFFVHTQDGPGCNTATVDFVH